MKCRHLIRIMPDFAAGELDEKTARLAQEHVEACPACAAEHAAYKEALTALAGPHPMAQMPDSLSTLEIPEPRLGIRWAKPVFATAALAAILAGIILMPRSHQPVKSPAHIANTPTAIRTVIPHTPKQLVAAGPNQVQLRHHGVRKPVLVAQVPKQATPAQRQWYDVHLGRPASQRIPAAPPPSSAETPRSSVIVVACDIPAEPEPVVSSPSVPAVLRIESTDRTTGDVQLYDYTRDSDGREQVIEMTSNVSRS